MGSKGSKTKRGTSGRVTPKGGHRKPTDKAGHGKADDHTSSRYTPPVPRSAKASPPWWPVLVFGLLGLGILIIMLDYTGILPGAPNNWLLLPALVSITAGLVALMNYR